MVTVSVEIGPYHESIDAPQAQSSHTLEENKMLKKMTMIAIAGAAFCGAHAQSNIPVSAVKTVENGFVTNLVGKSAGLCFLKIVNHTKYWIDIYVDDEAKGDVEPDGVSTGWFKSGYRELYGDAPGTDLYWGPSNKYLESNGSFTWNLY